VGSVYRLTLRQLAGRWRLTIIAGLAVMPVLVTALMTRSARGPAIAEFEAVVLSTMLAGTVIPLVVLAIASAAFGNEVEDRTLAFLTLAPISRWRIAVPKLLAALTITAPFIGGTAVVTSYVAFLGDAQAVAAVTVSALVAVALYSSAFVWLGLVSSHAIAIGLVYIALWEGLAAGFISGVRILSIRHYGMAVAHGLDPRRFAGDSHADPVLVWLLAALLCVGFTWLSVRRLRGMDVP
jgi:ABC-2 type transport system permease protein